MDNLKLLEFHLLIKGALWIKVMDNSMLPTIRSDNLILVNEALNIKRGDIVVFSREDYFVIHRVVFYKEGKIIFKGDNNLFLDDDSCVKKIIAKV